MLTHKEIKQHARELLRGNLGICFLCSMAYIIGLSLLTAVADSEEILILLFPLLIPSLSLGITKVYKEICQKNEPGISTIFSGFPQFGQATLTYVLLLVPAFIYTLIIIAPFLVFFVLIPPELFIYSGAVVLYCFVRLISPGSEFLPHPLLEQPVENIALPEGVIRFLLLYLIWAVFLSLLYGFFSLGFSMIPFIMAEHPKLSPVNVIKSSWQMVKGRRWNFLFFHLPFLLWFLLLSLLPTLLFIFIMNSGPSVLLTFFWILLSLTLVGITMIYVFPYLMTAQFIYYHNIKGNQTIFTPDFCPDFITVSSEKETDGSSSCTEPLSSLNEAADLPCPDDHDEHEDSSMEILPPISLEIDNDDPYRKEEVSSFTSTIKEKDDLDGEESSSASILAEKKEETDLRSKESSPALEKSPAPEEEEEEEWSWESMTQK